MQRSRSSVAAVAVLSSLAWPSACAFESGDPWGHAEVTAEAWFAPPADRLTDDGLLKTARNYAVRVDTLEVRVEAVSLVMQGAGAQAFDPADPPEGYSLCHNGHCHADDGSLPTYEEVAAAVGAGTGGARLTLTGSEPLVLTSTPAPVTLGSCPGACDLKRGTLATVELTIHSVRLVGRVFDLQTGDLARLPPEGVAVDAEIPLDVALTDLVGAEIGPGDDPGLRLAAVLAWPATFLDGVDFAAVTASDPAAADAVAASLLESDAAFDVSVSRFEL